MLDSLWELFQNHRISSVEQSANSAKITAQANLDGIAYMRSQIDTLTLANQAMWELLSERHGLTDHDLRKKMEEVDLRDGKLDGKLTRTEIKQCRECGHKVGKHRENCYWCGANLIIDNSFN
jgi:hypothetical protein